MKFGENIANQRKALGVHNDPRMNVRRYGFSDTTNTDSSVKHESFVDEEYSIGSVAEENVNEANQEVQQPHVQPSYRETFISKQDEKSERQYRTQVDQAQSNTDLQKEKTMEGTINDGEEEKNQIDVDPEEIKRLEKEKRMQANLAKFNMMVQNEQIMEGSGDNNGEENTQINEILRR